MVAMKKIGFIDYYIDEWHANNYPAWIRENAEKTGRQIDVAYAWAEIDNPNGLSTTDWCERYGVEKVSSLEQLIEKSDYLIVLSPDNPEHHERLGELALKSGKPVYMDKTFSPDLETGKRMFALAEQFETPLFSSSALRFSKEIAEFRKDNPNVEALEYMATTGPGTFDHYSVHQFEMIVSLMGTGAKRIKSLSSKQGRLLVIDYEDGRQASLSQLQQAPFQAHIQLTNGEAVWIPDCTEMFPRLIDGILEFFETGKVPVSKDETLEIMALIDAGKEALNYRDTWIQIEK